MIPDSVRAIRPGDPPVKIVRIPIQRPMDLHLHDFDELVMITKGHGLHFTESEEYTICAGDVFFIKPGITHGYRNTEDLELINVLYYQNNLSVPINDLRKMPGYRALFELEPALRQKDGFKSKLQLSLEELDDMCRIVDLIDEEIHGGKSGSIFLATSYLMQLIGQLSRRYEEKPSLQKLPLMRLSSVFSFIENNYTEEISLDEMAKSANMSKSTLIRAFRKTTGYTPLDYILRLRINKASEVLRHPDSSVTEAACSSGFHDSNYFSRQFRRFTGVSPREYRDMSRKLQ